MTWSDKYKRSIDCSNPKGFSQKAHCAGRKKRKLKEAGRPYSKTYLELLMKAGQGKTANTVNVKIPKSGHFMDEEKLNEKGIFTTIGRAAGQYVGNKIGADAAGASAGEALGVQADYHTQKAGRTAKARFKKFRRKVDRKGYKFGDFTRAMVNKPRKEEVENIDERNIVSSTLSKAMAKMSPTYDMAKSELKTRLKKDPKKSKISHAVAVAKKYTGVDAKTLHDVTEACWDTHKQVGYKMKGGKRVPNCVPKNEEAPANAVGGGNIAGLGVGPQGEPGVLRKRKKLTPFIMFMKRKKNV